MKRTIAIAGLGCIAAALAGSAATQAEALGAARLTPALGEDPARSDSPQLGLRVEEESKWSYVLRRPGPPLEGGPERTPDRETPLASVMKIELAAEDVALDDEGEMLFTLRLQQLPPHGAAEDARAEKAKAKVPGFSLRVDRAGQILALEPHEGASLAGNALSPAEIRSCIEWILGSGLHARPLQKGDVLEVGSQRSAVQAATPAREERPFALRYAFLRFESAQAGPRAEAATFSLHRPLEAEGAGEERQSERIGEAIYSLKDGLLTRLVCQPAPSEERERRPLDWMILERADG